MFDIWNNMPMPILTSENEVSEENKPELKSLNKFLREAEFDAMYKT